MRDVTNCVCYSHACFCELCGIKVDQRASLSVLNLAVDTEAKPTIEGKSIMTTALTHASFIKDTGIRNQHQTAMIGGGGVSPLRA